MFKRALNFFAMIVLAGLCHAVRAQSSHGEVGACVMDSLSNTPQQLSRAQCAELCRAQERNDVACFFNGIDEAAVFWAGYKAPQEEDAPIVPAEMSVEVSDDTSAAANTNGTAQNKQGFGFDERIEMVHSRIDLIDGLMVNSETAEGFRKEAQRLSVKPDDSQAWPHHIELLKLEAGVSRAAGGGVYESQKLIAALIRDRELKGESPLSASIQEAKSRLSYLKTLNKTFASSGGEMDPAERSHIYQELDILMMTCTLDKNGKYTETVTKR